MPRDLEISRFLGVALVLATAPCHKAIESTRDQVFARYSR